MRRQLAAVAIAATAISVAVVPAWSTAAVPAHHASSAPSSPRLPRAYQSRGGVTVRWHNPRHGLHRVVVRVARGDAAPATPRSGRAVRVAAPRAHRALIRYLRPGTRYSASVFALGRGGRFRTPAVVRFTTLAGRGASAPAAYTGRVVDTDGKPLVNAVVQSLSYSTFSGGPTTRTGTDGGFVLNLAAGEWLVYVSGERATGGNSDTTGYAPTDGDTVRLTAGQVLAAGTVTLDAGAEIAGRVRDAAGRPLAGADVFPGTVDPYVETFNGGIYTSNVVSGSAPRTAADGTWTLRGVPSTTLFRMCAAGTGAVPRGGVPGSYPSRCADRTTVVRPRTSVTLPDLRLFRGTGGTFAGRVVGYDGRPVAGTLLLEPVGNTDSFGYGRVLPNGRFRIDQLAAGRYRACVSADESLRGRAGTGYRYGCRVVAIHRGGITTGRLVAHPGAAAGGTVTDGRGRPLANVGVAVESATESDGEYTAAGGSQGGSYSSFAGDVAQTDAHGRWEVRGLSPGRYRACFDGSGVTRPATGAVTGCRRPAFATYGRTRRTGIDATLPVGGAIVGTITDTAGRPVEDAFVMTLGGGSDDTTTDERGHFALRGLPSGTRRLCIVRFDQLDTVDETPARTCATRVRVQRGHATRVNRRIPALGGITVRVVDEQGEPVAGVDATALRGCVPELRGDPDCAANPLFPKTSYAAASELTDVSGTASLAGIAPGRYAVCLFAFYGTTAAGGSPTGYADSCRSHTFDIAVTRGVTRTVTMTLGRGGSVSGRVTRPDGRAAAGVGLVVAGSPAQNYPDPYADEYYPGENDGPTAAQVTAVDGSFTVIGVRPGSRRVCAQPPYASGLVVRCAGGESGDATGGTPVTVTAGTDTAGVAIPLTAGGTLTGHVRTRAASKGPFYVFLFRGEGGKPVDDARVGPDGAWSLNGLSKGTYRLCAVDLDTYVGRCWRGLPWSLKTAAPPLRRATPIAVRAGQTRSGFEFVLPR